MSSEIDVAKCQAEKRSFVIRNFRSPFSLCALASLRFLANSSEIDIAKCQADKRPFVIRHSSFVIVFTLISQILLIFLCVVLRVPWWLRKASFRLQASGWPVR